METSKQNNENENNNIRKKMAKSEINYNISIYGPNAMRRNDNR